MEIKCDLLKRQLSQLRKKFRKGYVFNDTETPLYMTKENDNNHMVNSTIFQYVFFLFYQTIHYKI